jgi:hypothetical protein
MITPAEKQIPESQFPSLRLEIRHDRWFHLPSILRFAQLDFEERLCWDTVVLDKVLYLFQVSNDFFLFSFLILSKVAFLVEVYLQHQGSF